MKQFYFAIGIIAMLIAIIIGWYSLATNSLDWGILAALAGIGGIMAIRKGEE